MNAADYVHYLIGGGQLAVLCGVFWRLGNLSGAMRAHLEEDRLAFGDLRRRVLSLERWRA